MSLTTPDLGRRTREVRFNPIRSLTPATLSSALDEFESGYLRRAVLIWEAIESRDETLMTAVPKRMKSVSRRSWEIVRVDDSAQADADAEALEFFYNNLTATKATDLNVRGGFRRLAQQMMAAEFYQYAAHEIIWQPRKVGARRLLTAEFRFVPLWLFENRTGQLRYTGPDGLINGTALERDAWMIHCGDGLMKSLSICRMFKSLSLQDWLNFSEKFGIPGVHGETSAAKDTPEWNAFVEALAAFANDWVTATSQGTKINLIESSKTGDQPFEPMVERMSRAMIALCRGSDLGTLSSQDGAGASLQGDETEMLLEDDCASISETLNTHVDRFVLRWLNGPNKENLAYFKLMPPVQQDTKGDIDVDKHIVDLGGELPATETYERYGRTLPDSMKDVMLKKSPTPAPVEIKKAESENLQAENDDAATRVARAIGSPTEWMSPVADVFADLEAKATDKSLTDADLLAALQSAADRMPELFHEMDRESFVELLEGAMGGAALEGLRDSLKQQSKK